MPGDKIALSVAALIPVKGFANAKQRLAPMLGSAERALLAESMFRDTLVQTLQARSFDATFVVTCNHEVSRIAIALGARVILEPQESGETAAVHRALSVIKREGFQAALVIPADIPLLEASDLDALVHEEVTTPSVLLVPSHDKMGTNALLLSPPDVLRLRFGHDSFAYHLNEARAKGLQPKSVLNERLALDIDEPEDLQRFLSVRHDSATRRTVLAMGIPELRDPSDSQI
jgi:2-phospho-L-lactate guanylyltransferase